MPDLKKLHNLAGQLQRAKKTHATNRAGRWYEIRNAGVTDTTPVYLYDMVGDDGWGGGISQQDFVNEISQITTPKIDLHISSEGGSVFDGIAIYESLKQHPSIVGVTIDSLAASAASFIAMAADPYDPATDSGGIKMARNARMMIHDAAIGGAYGAGNEADMRAFAAEVVKLADLLGEMSLNIADIYAQRAGGDVEAWRALMLAETWFSAQQAKDSGLADAILGEEPATPVESTTAEDEADIAEFLAALKGAWSA